jgi:micrococcal nuclease
MSFLRYLISKLYKFWAGQSSIFLMVVILFASCAQPASDAQPGVVYREETVALPTGAPTPEPTPVSTRVLSAKVLTPSPTPSITPIPDEVRALVVEVTDGDTITVVMEGDPPGLNYEVRYLGIDAPPNTASVSWGVVAFEVNRKLTNGNVVRLERDQSDVDEEGRLLRYVYLGDELLNITLVEQGLARANITEPDTRFQAEILAAEKQAKASQLGLWGKPPTPTPRVVASPTTGIITVTTTLTATVVTTGTTEPEATTTVEVETTATIEPEATPEETPAGTPSPTPTEAATPSQGAGDEVQDNPETPEATIEPTSTGDSQSGDLQGPQ